MKMKISIIVKEYINNFYDILVESLSDYAQITSDFKGGYD